MLRHTTFVQMCTSQSTSHPVLHLNHSITGRNLNKRRPRDLKRHEEGVTAWKCYRFRSCDLKQGGSIHHACWLSTSHAYELMAPLGDQEVELPPIYLTEPLWGGNKGMDRKELILLLSLLPNVYVHAFFHSFELFWKNGSFQLECQDAAVSWRVVELANNLLISNVLHLVNYFSRWFPK